MTIQRELLAKRYGKFDLKKKKGKHQTATSIDFSMLIQNIFLFKIFKFDHGKSRVYNSDVPPELYSRHGGKMI